MTDLKPVEWEYDDDLVRMRPVGSDMSMYVNGVVRQAFEARRRYERERMLADLRQEAEEVMTEWIGRMKKRSSP